MKLTIKAYLILCLHFQVSEPAFYIHFLFQIEIDLKNSEMYAMFIKNGQNSHVYTSFIERKAAVMFMMWNEQKRLEQEQMESHGNSRPTSHVSDPRTSTTSVSNGTRGVVMHIQC